MGAFSQTTEASNYYHRTIIKQNARIWIFVILFCGHNIGEPIKFKLNPILPKIIKLNKNAYKKTTEKRSKPEKSSVRGERVGLLQPEQNLP